MKRIDERAVTQAAEVAWNAQPALRAEFSTLASLVAYQLALARGATEPWRGSAGVVTGFPMLGHGLVGLRLSMPADIGMRAQITLSGLDRGVIEGHASVVGRINRKGFKIAPGAFKAAATTAPLPMLWAHDWARPIGRWDTLREDARGLFARGVLNLQVEAGRTAFEHLRHQDVTGLSIGFGVPPGAAVERDGVMTLSQVELFEISVVAVPADAHARVATVQGE